MKNEQVHKVSLLKRIYVQGDISGDIHFDDDENWTLGSYIGINLTQVQYAIVHIRVPDPVVLIGSDLDIQL